MTLLLDNSKPSGLEAKCWGRPFGDYVILTVPGKILQIPLKEFLKIVRGYLFSNDMLVDLVDDGEHSVRAIFLNGCGILLDDKPFALLNTFDFSCLVAYVFTNTNLEKDDPRQVLVNELVFGDQTDKVQPGAKQLFNWLTTLEVVEGWQEMIEGKKIPGLRRFEGTTCIAAE